MVDLHVTLAGAGLSQQIFDQLRDRIGDHQLSPGEQLPSSRALADRLAVSRNTVSAAYDRLRAQGLITSIPGRGVFVAVAPPLRTGSPGPNPEHRPTAAGPEPAPESAGQLRPQPVWDRISGVADMSGTAPEFDLRSGIPSLQHFPYTHWRSLLSRRLRRSTAASDLYGDPAGRPALRTAIARHIAVSRGVRVDPSEVFVTNGFQQSADLISRVLLAPGEVVAVEDPGYPPPVNLFRSQRMRVIGVPVDDQGIVVEEIPRDARLVYVTPSHQYPLGMRMSLDRRRQLLDRAVADDLVIVEDDYDSEFRFAGRPLEPLQAMDSRSRVLYVGSFSKTLLPSLRLGFVVAPAPLHDALRKAKSVADWQTGGPMQDALAEFIDSGRYDQHLRRMRRLYEQRHHQIDALLATDFAGLLSPIPSLAGLHITARLVVPLDDHAVVLAAREHGLELGLPLSGFGLDRPADPGLVIGYGAIGTEQIAPAFDLLHRILDQPAGRR